MTKFVGQVLFVKFVAEVVLRFLAQSRVTRSAKHFRHFIHLAAILKLTITADEGRFRCAVQAAAEALAKWKFEVLQNGTTEIVQLTFQP